MLPSLDVRIMKTTKPGTGPGFVEKTECRPVQSERRRAREVMPEAWSAELLNERVARICCMASLKHAFGPKSKGLHTAALNFDDAMRLNRPVQSRRERAFARPDRS